MTINIRLERKGAFGKNRPSGNESKMADMPKPSVSEALSNRTGGIVGSVITRRLIFSRTGSHLDFRLSTPLTASVEFLII